MKYKLLVIKIGSHLIDKGKESFIDSVAMQINELKNNGCKIIIVSSGAIATGIRQYKISKKPTRIAEKQAFAAIGQPLLMGKYIEIFKKYNITVAQILLTREDFNDRKRYLNIKNTLNFLLKLGVVPIINENDTVTYEEIKLGDNDTLSAIVAVKMDADILVLLTDVDGIYDTDPSLNKDARLIKEIYNLDELKRCVVDSKSTFFCGTGGMRTKIEASKICMLSGIDVVIANGMRNKILLDIAMGNRVGTYIYSMAKKIDSKDKWIAFATKPKGKIFVDDGAAMSIVKKHKSLLPVGVRRIEGEFKKGDIISICTLNGKEIAKGIANYSYDEVNMIKGKKTNEVKQIFPSFKYEEVVHANNMVIL